MSDLREKRTGRFLKQTGKTTPIAFPHIFRFSKPSK